MKRLFLVLVLSSVIIFSYGQSSKNSSVLSTGYWYKIAVSETGFHKLTPIDLEGMGFDLSSLNPANIRIYGNGGGMLPMPANEPRYDDLMENAIRVVGEEDGVFDPDDYVLFYAKGPVDWTYHSLENIFEHQTDDYDDYAYYFITSNLGPGKRIEKQISVEEAPTHSVTSFDDYKFHEKNEHNLIRSGREWYGEIYDVMLTHHFAFNFPNLDTESWVKLKTGVVARSYIDSDFNYIVNGNNLVNIVIPKIQQNPFSAYARFAESLNFFSSDVDNIVVDVSYHKSSGESVGWQDYITVNARRHLIHSESQMLFRDIESVGPGNISQFTISGVPWGCEVIEVSDPLNVKLQIPIETGIEDEISFKLETEELREFILMDGEVLYTPEFIGQVENQNLHEISGVDMLIVAHLSLIDAAIELAEFHSTKDGLNVSVVTPEQIYNEFSSGSQDITAIRDFVKMLWDQKNSKGEQLEYLLLFGDASYDYKERVNNNTNLVPVFQSRESLKPVSSYLSDDFFGCLEDDEGNWNADDPQETLDISIGRIPVSNHTDAMNLVNKIIHYVNNPDAYHNWRNKISHVADDEDVNTHMFKADELANITYSEDLNMNVEKIYFDFYPQIRTPEGDRYPHAQAALNKSIQNGTMILSYMGHGSDTMWALEEVLTPSLINSWTNINNLPLFMTGACSFGPFDNPDLVSGAEQILLKEDGGGIGVISSSRLNFSGPGFSFSEAFFEYLFSTETPDDLTIGNIYKNAKNEYLNSSISKLTLLGDPAIRFPVPQNRVVTTHINGVEVGEPLDTIPPTGNITINGYISNEDGFLLQDFNGELELSFYDKILNKHTRNNDGTGVFYFDVQDSILYQGSFNIANGLFEATFSLPADMDEDFGVSKISYYAVDYPTEAAGYFDELVIGGILAGFNDPFAKKGELKIYPTITGGPLYVDLSDIEVSNAAILIYSINGKMLLNTRLDNENGINKYTLDVSGLPKGMHFVRLLTEGREYHAKVVVL